MTNQPKSSSSLIFPAPEDNLINLDNWRSRVWKKAFSSIDVAYRPLLQMRHTFATLAVSADADIYWVSKQLGHTGIRTTLKYYARFQPQVDERNLERLDVFSQAENSPETDGVADPGVS